MSRIPFVGIFSPRGTGLSLYGNDLVITSVSKQLIKLSHETFIVKDFLVKDGQQLKPILVQQKKLDGEIILSVPRELCVIREIEFPYANIKELREALTYQLDSFIPFNNEDVYFDVHLLSHNRHNSKVLIVAVKKEVLDDILSRLKALEIIPSRVIITPFAFIPLIVDKRGSVVIINKNKNNYNYNLYENSLLKLSSIARNEDELTKQLKTGAPDEVFFTNKDNGILQKDSPVQVSQMDENSESYGAALYGISGYPCKLSLIKLRRKQLNPQTSAMCFLIGFLVLFIFLIPYIQKINNLATLKTVDSRIKSIKKDVKIVEKTKEKMELLEATVINVDKISEKYIPRIDVILELARILPNDAWTKTIKIDNNLFEIEGDAVSSTNLIPILEDSPLFSTVGLASPVTKTQSGREKFRIKGKIEKQK
ncbi:MAG: pilus assembly protein PilM [Candidatus Kuenenia sp.]|nr:pilus assembly protein PilM [Candidatus Kuenenia hertensis]